MQKPALAVLVSFLFFFPCGSTSGQSIADKPNETKRDENAISIAARSLAAMGGAAGVAPMRALGTIQSSGKEDGSIEVVANNARTYKTVITRGTDRYEYLSNQGIGEVTVDDKKRYMASAHLLGDSCDLIPIFSLLAQFTDPTVEVEAPRDGTVNGAPTIVLQLRFAQITDSKIALANIAEVELDAKTLLPIRLRTQLRHSSNLQIVGTLEYVYDDYKSEEQYLLPHQVKVYSDGVLQSLVNLNSFEFNYSADLTVR